MKKKKKIIIICAIIVVVLVALVVLLFFSPKKEKQSIKDLDPGVYILEDYQDPDLVTISNKDLKKEQCLGSVCVKNVVISAFEKKGKVECDLTNKGEEKAGGYLKLLFGDKALFAIYQLEPGETKSTTMVYEGMDLRKMKKYELKELSEEDYSLFVN